MTSRGILIANLGSPDSPSRGDVRRFLREFLSDPYVIGLPSPLRQLLVRGLIAPFRSKSTAEGYKSIWHTPEGPLRRYTRLLAEAIGEVTQVPTVSVMRYGNPSVTEGLERLGDVDEVVLVPLFPQHADSTRTTVIEHTFNLIGNARLRVVAPFYNEPEYQRVLTEHTLDNLGIDMEHLLISFHSLPVSHVVKADPTGEHCLRTPNCCETPSPAHLTCYRRHCLQTAVGLGSQLAIPHSVSFQSRIGRTKWLAPYTSDEILRLARQGIKRLAVVCPAFTVDNFETLEEIGIRATESFKRAGGEELQLVPCLNTNLDWVEFLAERALAA